MIAYRIPDIAPAAAVDEMRTGKAARFARLRGAGPWQFSAHPAGATLASWKHDVATVPALESFAEPRETFDGMLYYGPKEKPAIIALAKDGIASEWETDVALTCGISVTIAMAVAEPLRARFTGPAREPATEYGRLMRQVARLIDEQTDDAPVTTDHPDVQRLIVLAIQQRYRVTAELLEDLDFISTADFFSILAAANASSKKAPAAATGT